MGQSGTGLRFSAQRSTGRAGLNGQVAGVWGRNGTENRSLAQPRRTERDISSLFFRAVRFGIFLSMYMNLTGLPFFDIAIAYQFSVPLLILQIGRGI